jgi:hypothetical protein
LVCGSAAGYFNWEEEEEAERREERRKRRGNEIGKGKSK